MAVGILNYGAGNLYSIMGALDYINAPYDLVSDGNNLKKYSHLLLPGVGSYRKAMSRLHELGLYEPIRRCVLEDNIPILGICLGMQLLCASSDEDGFTEGLGLMNGHFSIFDVAKRKVPHIGFDSVQVDGGTHLFKGIDQGVDFYFVHSYRLIETEPGCNYAFSEHDGEKFVCAFEKRNIYGTQFHPELSQGNGLKLLQNFLIRTIPNG